MKEMKKFVLFFCAAAVALVGCEKNNAEENMDEENVKLSDLEYFTDGLVTLDDDENITGYNVGDNLNEADPSEISVPVDTYEQARDLFLKWLPADAQPSVNGKTYTWEMTDEENKSEGQVVFEESTVAGTIATIKINASGAKVRTVKFIPTSAWPENASAMEEYMEENYYLGAEIQVNKNKGASTGTFVVIREWTKQENGIMIRMETKEYDTAYNGFDQKNCSSVGTTQTVGRVLHQGNNYEYFVNIYGKQHNWPDLSKRFITSKKKTTWYGSTNYYYVRLSTGEVNKLDKAIFTNPGYRKVYIYWFKPDGNNVTIW